MTISDKLKAICNYSEESKSLPPSASISYMGFDTMTEGQRREKKRKERNLKIDSLLGEEDESSYDSDSDSEYEIMEDISEIPTISPKIYSMTVSAKRIDEFAAYHDIVCFLDKSSQSRHHFPANLDYSPVKNEELSEREQHEMNFRRIVTKIMHASNFIASDGRMGPATAVIVGSENWHWFGEENIGINGFLGNIRVILDEKIDPKKIIVARGGRKDSAGILCTKCVPDSTFYIKETDRWESQYVWFWIK